MNKFFPEINGRFGFGCMRFPVDENRDVLHGDVCRMVDEFISAGLNYFDTAHGYLGGKSEIAVRECLTSRYPREAYILTNKLSTPHFSKNEDIRPLFERQLEICGVDYFDFYLMHAQAANNYDKYVQCRAYETAFELKREGKVRHVGISFHDGPEMLDRILTDYPEIEAVQIQFNYLDYNDPSVQSKAVYDVCVKHGKPVIVMEPIKGGSLAAIPPAALDMINGLGGGSPASYALRFAADFENVFMVLSGMGSIDMVRENVSVMRDPKPLSEREKETLEKVKREILSKAQIACTACAYCTEVCPKGIKIPTVFACFNEKAVFNNWGAGYYYSIHTKDGGKASECIKCGKCESACPQHLPIRKLLEAVADEFEKK